MIHITYTYLTSSLSVQAVSRVYPAQLHHQSHQAGDSAQFHLRNYPSTLPAFWEALGSTDLSPFYCCRKHLELAASQTFSFPGQLSSSDHTLSPLYTQHRPLIFQLHSRNGVYVCVSKPDVKCHNYPDNHEPNGGGWRGFKTCTA